MESSRASLADTERFAKQLAKIITAPKVIFLQGELGAGKTTFARFFLQALGYEGLVKSPTYSLVEFYEVAGFDIYHLDLYRLQSIDELELLGLRDYHTDSAIFLIEWPERVAAELPAPDICIKFQIDGGQRHFSYDEKAS